MPELSIIVPIYKVEAYLPRCIDSILAQTFTDFELILIDDGSPDKCGEIMEEYAAKDSRIVTIHQENKGVSAARNAGLRIARGTYIGFVDPDDWIEEEMYEKMLHKAKETLADVVICGTNDYTENEIFLRSLLNCERSYDQQELLEALYGMPNPIGGAVWNKIFIRSKVCAVRFKPELSMAEDWVYLFQAFDQCRSGYQMKECYYNIRIRADSATRANEVQAMYDNVFGGRRRLLLLARKHSRHLECLATEKYIDDCIRYSNKLREAGIRTSEKWIRKFFEIRLQALKIMPRALVNHLIQPKKLLKLFCAVLRV